MSKIKVGYLPLYIKLYDDSDPAKRNPMVSYMETLTAMLESQGLELVRVPVCRIKEEFEAAIDVFHRENVCAIITQHLAYSPSLESIDALERAGVPLIIVDTTPDYSLIDKAGYEKCISVNHGIHGVQDMCNLLRRRDVPYHLCVGHAMHSDVIAKVSGMCRAAAVANAYKTARVGSVGGSFTGMGDFMVSDEDYKFGIGAEVFYMTPDDVRESLSRVSEEELEAEIALDARVYTMEVADEAAYREAVRSGLAVRKWAESLSLSAMTINFLTLDVCTLPKMPFAECGKAMARGLGYAGEGDVLTAGLVGALRSVYHNTTFTEMFCPDWKEDVLLMSHMGEANPDLAQWKPVMRTTPFNYNSCGDTAAPYMCYRPGMAVLVNVAPAKKGFSLIATEVEMLACGLEYGVYRNSVQGWLKPCMPLTAFLAKYSELGGTHHSALVYDADIHEILAFGTMMGFEVHQI